MFNITLKHVKTGECRTQEFTHAQATGLLLRLFDSARVLVSYTLTKATRQQGYSMEFTGTAATAEGELFQLEIVLNIKGAIG